MLNNYIMGKVFNFLKAISSRPPPLHTYSPPLPPTNWPQVCKLIIKIGFELGEI